MPLSADLEGMERFIGECVRVTLVAAYNRGGEDALDDISNRDVFRVLTQALDRPLKSAEYELARKKIHETLCDMTIFEAPEPDDLELGTVPRSPAPERGGLPRPQMRAPASAWPKESERSPKAAKAPPTPPKEEPTKAAVGKTHRRPRVRWASSCFGSARTPPLRYSRGQAPCRSVAAKRPSPDAKEPSARKSTGIARAPKQGLDFWLCCDRCDEWHVVSEDCCRDRAGKTFFCEYLEGTSCPEALTLKSAPPSKKSSAATESQKKAMMPSKGKKRKSLAPSEQQPLASLSEARKSRRGRPTGTATAQQFWVSCDRCGKWRVVSKEFCEDRKDKVYFCEFSFNTTCLTEADDARAKSGGQTMTREPDQAAKPQACRRLT